MQDHYTGEAGTFYTDPDTGMRVTAEEYEANLAAKAAKKPILKSVPVTKNKSTEESN